MRRPKIKSIMKDKKPIHAVKIVRGEKLLWKFGPDGRGLRMNWFRMVVGAHSMGRAL